MSGKLDLAERREILQREKEALFGLQSSASVAGPSASVLNAATLNPTSSAKQSSPPPRQIASLCDVDIPPERPNDENLKQRQSSAPSSFILHSELLGDDDYNPGLRLLTDHDGNSDTKDGSRAVPKRAGVSGDQNYPLKYQLSLRDSETTDSRCVTAIKFHTKFDDVVLSSHSERTDGRIDASQGIVAIWGLDGGRGALHRSLMAQAAITALELPSISPTLVIGGTSGGNVLMWDIRMKTSLPIATFGGDQCEPATSHNHQPVTAIKTTTSPSSVFYSSSASGYLYKWSLSKTDYPISQSVVHDATGTGELTFSCFDFPRSSLLSTEEYSNPGKANIFAGSYDGGVYRLTSNGAQWDLGDGRAGHSAAVTAVSPHPLGHRESTLDDVVVTSSRDWTIKLWLLRKGVASQELASFDMIENGPVNDVGWSPQFPTVFCAGDEAGVLSLVDVSGQISPDKAPFYQMTPPDTTTHPSITRVQWSPSSKNICTGDVNGNIVLWGCGSTFAGLPNAEWTAQYFKAKLVRGP